MRPLVTGADLLIANEEDLQSVLGIAVAGVNVTAARSSPTAYRTAAEQTARELRCQARGDHAAREPLGQRQRLERGALRRGIGTSAIAASTTSFAWSIASAAATVSPRA